MLINTTKKLVINICYNKQYACVYLQPFYARRIYSGKITFFNKGAFILRFRSRGISLPSYADVCKFTTRNLS